MLLNTHSHTKFHFDLFQGIQSLGEGFLGIFHFTDSQAPQIRWYYDQDIISESMGNIAQAANIAYDQTILCLQEAGYHAESTRSPSS